MQIKEIRYGQYFAVLAAVTYFPAAFNDIGSPGGIPGIIFDIIEIIFGVSLLIALILLTSGLSKFLKDTHRFFASILRITTALIVILSVVFLIGYIT